MKPVDESPRFVVGHCRQFTTVLYNCSLNDRKGILSAKKCIYSLPEQEEEECWQGNRLEIDQINPRLSENYR